MIFEIELPLFSVRCLSAQLAKKHTGGIWMLLNIVSTIVSTALCFPASSEPSVP